MITCPHCHRPVSGSARACGYCGMSLVQDYFSPAEKAREQYPKAHAGSITATIFGILGGVCVVAAAVIQFLPALTGGIFTPNALWWARSLSMIFLGALFFIQQLMLHGLRFSMLFDGFWLFASIFGLNMVRQGYFHGRLDSFYGNAWIPILLGVGCLLSTISCLAGILTYRKP